MWAVGERAHDQGCFVRAAPHKNESMKGNKQLEETNGQTRTVTKLTAGLLTKCGHDCLIQHMRAVERKQNKFPPNELGGPHGITAVCNLSCNLGNESHCNCNDMEPCFSAFAERVPGTAKNWSMCFPNMQVHQKGKTHHGLRIELCHGAMMQQDGRVMKHFTSVTDVGNENDCCGCFFAPNCGIVPKESCQKAERGATQKRKEREAAEMAGRQKKIKN